MTIQKGPNTAAKHWLFQLVGMMLAGLKFGLRLCRLLGELCVWR